MFILGTCIICLKHGKTRSISRGWNSANSDVEVCLCVSPVLTAAPLLCKGVIQRVRAGAYGGTILAVRGTGQETVARLRSGGSKGERTHPFPTFWLDQLPHLQSDPVAASTKDRPCRERCAGQQQKQSIQQNCFVCTLRAYFMHWNCCCNQLLKSLQTINIS